MAKKKATVIMPQTREILAQMGEQIRLARLRRKLSLELVAERAGISRATLISIEKGTPTVSIGSYAAVLHALNNMDSDLLLIAKDDEFGRKLQDLALPTRRRAPKKGRVAHGAGRKRPSMYMKIGVERHPLCWGGCAAASSADRETFSFEYDPAWLSSAESSFSLDRIWLSTAGGSMCR